jgi:hypothetical protein
MYDIIAKVKSPRGSPHPPVNSHIQTEDVTREMPWVRLHRSFQNWFGVTQRLRKALRKALCDGFATQRSCLSFHGSASRRP